MPNIVSEFSANEEMWKNIYERDFPEKQSVEFKMNFPTYKDAYLNRMNMWYIVISGELIPVLVPSAKINPQDKDYTIILVIPPSVEDVIDMKPYYYGMFYIIGEIKYDSIENRKNIKLKCNKIFSTHSKAFEYLYKKKYFEDEIKGINMLLNIWHELKAKYVIENK